MAEKKRIRKAIPLLVMAACFITGVTLGFLYNDITAGILIGLGAGFFAMGMLRLILNREKKPPTEDSETTSS